MKTLGLTGGIGSGKSIVARILAVLGIPVYDCDQRAKALYNEDEDLRRAMIALCGERLYATEFGRLDRAYLAEQIFGNHTLLEAVNALVHPAVRADIDRWKAQQAAEGHRLVAIESAILLDSEGLRERVDSVVLVSAPLELRIARAIRRDGSTEAAIRQRIAAQMSEEAMRELADHILLNDEKTALLPQVEELLSQVN
ncbi:MAG: dephospho-CoA kinase [Porphyromonas sp.]|nr:dephospho-CoA kinase [Porphyromonas sp.]